MRPALQGVKTFLRTWALAALMHVVVGLILLEIWWEGRRPARLPKLLDVQTPLLARQLFGRYAHSNMPSVKGVGLITGFTHRWQGWFFVGINLADGGPWFATMPRLVPFHEVQEQVNTKWWAGAPVNGVIRP